MKLVEWLGARPVGSKGQKHCFGLYECPICHDHFECRVCNIKSGNTTKCSSCADKHRSKAKTIKAASEFIEKARATHGDLYEYSLVDYSGAHINIKITCRKHGEFGQTPNNHLCGKGCPECARERSNIAMRMSEKNDRPTLLYYIYFPEVNLWKIGCTSKTLAERFKQEKLKYTIIKTKEYTSGNEAYRVEKFILDATKATRYKGTVLGVKGNSELRTQPIENLELLIEEAEKYIKENNAY